MRWLLLLSLLIVLTNSGCNQIKEADSAILYESMTTSRQTHLHEKPEVRANRLETLTEGERIEVLLEPRNRWLKVKTPSGKVGWVESRDILKRSLYEEWQQLKTLIKDRKPEMSGDSLEEATLRLRPGRDAFKIYKLAQSKKVDVMLVAHTEYIDPNAAKMVTAAEKKPEKPAVTDAKAPKVKKKRRNADSDKKFDTWFLIRTDDGTVGWVYYNLVNLHVPDEVLRYAEGKTMVTCHILSSFTDDEGNAHPNYITIEREDNSDRDFDRIRVFYWNPKRQRYELSLRIQGIAGIFPVEINRVDANQPGHPRFKVHYIDEKNPDQITIDEYEMINQQTKKVASTSVDL